MLRSFTQAQEIIKNIARSFGTEKVLLDEALGRVMAETVFSDRDYPPFHRSAMDGYAMRLADFEKGVKKFVVVETIFAGQNASKEIAFGECYKIMTGAPVPSSADVVVRREDTEEQDGKVRINLDQLKPFQNIARKGEDVPSGSEVIANGTQCNPAAITALASLGKFEVSVQKLPVVALFTTGNEVVPVHRAVGPHQIRNSNAHLLKALLRQWQITPQQEAHIADDPMALTKSLQDFLHSDMIIMSGGVSAGDADYVPEILQNLGVEKLFHKVAIKPGKPIWCGKLPAGGIVFALPGNPLSCHVTFKLFIETYLRYCFGLPVSKNLRLPIADSRKKRSDLDEFFPVKIHGNPSVATPLSFNGSGDILAALHADAFALQPAQQLELMNGDVVLCFPIV